MNDILNSILIVIGIAVALGGFFAPAIIGFWKRADSAAIIVVINIIGGWTFVGWLIALVMAIGADSNRSYKFSPIEEDLDEKAQTKDPGDFFDYAMNAISKKETEIQKAFGKGDSKLDIIPGGLYVQSIVMPFFGVAAGIGVAVLINLIVESELIPVFSGVLIFIVCTLYPPIEKLVLRPERARKAQQKGNAIRQVQEKYISSYIRELKKNFGEKIHNLGLMTAEDLLERAPEIPANPYLAGRVLASELEDGSMSTVDLADGSTLYRTELGDVAELENCETVHMEID